MVGSDNGRRTAGRLFFFADVKVNAPSTAIFAFQVARGRGSVPNVIGSEYTLVGPQRTQAATGLWIEFVQRAQVTCSVNPATPVRQNENYFLVVIRQVPVPLVRQMVTLLIDVSVGAFNNPILVLVASRQE
jgi:hypothetical protein